MKRLRDYSLKGKKVLLRVDWNVPVHNEEIKNDLRIRSSLETISYLLEKEAFVVIVSHRGRPKGRDIRYSMEICRDYVSNLLKKTIHLIPDFLETDRKKNLSFPKGEILLLENIRFYSEETSKEDSVRLDFAKKLVEGFDLVVNDAFGVSHRKNASSYDIGFEVEMVKGFLLEKEIESMKKIMEKPDKPFVTVMGGAKVSDKLKVIEKLLPRVDYLLIGGAMAYTFYHAMGYRTGKSLVERDQVRYCKDLLKKYPDKIILPEDSNVCTEFNFELMKLDQPLIYRSKEEMLDEEMGIDIGKKTLSIYEKYLNQAKTIFWNGPMGIFECKESASGTMGIAKILSQLTKQGVTTIVGGGDSISAIQRGGYIKSISHASTGGGASLDYLAGKKLPVLEVLS